jgi:PII-like signaling protein
MRQELTAQELTIYVGEDDKWRGGLLYPAIVERLKEIGIAGVTVLHGSEGFGAHARLHTARIEVLFSGLPVLIEAVDIPERIALAMEAMDEMITEGLVSVHEVRAVRYLKSPAQ